MSAQDNKPKKKEKVKIYFSVAKGIADIWEKIWRSPEFETKADAFRHLVRKEAKERGIIK